MTRDEPGNLHALLSSRAEESPDAIAVIENGRSLTYRQLDDHARAMAGVFAREGISNGNRIALWLPNTAAYLVASFACYHLGAIAVAVNTRYRSVEAADIIRRSEAKLLALWPDFRQIDFMGILSSMPHESLASLRTVLLCGDDASREGLSWPPGLAHATRIDYAEALESPAPITAAPTGNAGSGCNIFTTSGTTRAPKFVLHEQHDILAHALDVGKRLGPVIRRRAQLQALPLCGVFGFTQAMATIAAGGTLVMMSSFDARSAVELIDRHDIAYLNATDDMVDALLEADDRPRALPSVEFCGYGAFNADPEYIVKRAESRGLRLVGLYGMSECQALFAIQDPELPTNVRMLPGGRLTSARADVRVRDPETGKIAKPGDRGELEVRGPSLMACYFGNEAATNEALTADGFLRTGDLGYMTGNHSFVFLARMGDVLRLGGFLVNPVEIETHVQEHPAVSGCQVVATSINGRMKAIAFVTLSENEEFDSDELIDHCRDSLAPYKVPVRFTVLKEFPVPHGPNGTKIRRSDLRSWAENPELIGSEYRV